MSPDGEGSKHIQQHPHSFERTKGCARKETIFIRSCLVVNINLALKRRKRSYPALYFLSPGIKRLTRRKNNYNHLPRIRGYLPQ
jgi:hypothetical protein